REEEGGILGIGEYSLHTGLRLSSGPEGKIEKDLQDESQCKMLTMLPMRNWKECEAVPSSLSSLVAAIVPGHLRKLNTVFEISGLHIVGLSSVRSESDEWILPSCATCRRAYPCQAHPNAAEESRLALRAVFVDSDCQCSMILYHDTITSCVNVGKVLEFKDTPQLRKELLEGFRSALWRAKVTFRENDYHQVLELECRHLERFLSFDAANPDVSAAQLDLPRCFLGGGCPVAPLREVKRDTDLGVLSVHNIDASSVRALVMFNNVTLPDDETVQKEMQATSAMRIKRSVDCLLSGTSEPFQSKIRAAGPASAVTWLLRGPPQEVHHVVLMQTETVNEYAILSHVLVKPEAVDSVMSYYRYICSQQEDTEELSFESTLTPAKRIRTLRESMPTPSKTSGAWQDQ
ncbi:unnamed protein product, partial [Symbiodinium sp. CCMP2456]